MASSSPLCAAFLRTAFEEGEDFLLYTFTAQDISPPLARVAAAVLHSKVRGVIHASDTVMSSLVGEPVDHVVVSHTAEDGSVVCVRFGVLNVKHALLLVAFPESAPCASLQAVCKTYIDVCYYLLGPLSPSLCAWGDVPDLPRKLDPVFAYLFSLDIARAALGLAQPHSVILPTMLEMEVDELLSTLEVGAPAAGQLSSDGAPLCLCVGAALFLAGSLVLAHGLDGIVGEAVYHTLVANGLMQRVTPHANAVAQAASSQSSAHTKPPLRVTALMHLPVHVDTHCSTRPSSLHLWPVDSLAPSPSATVARAAAAVQAHTRVLSCVCEGDAVLCVVLQQRYPVTCELDPHWHTPMADALQAAREAGLLDAVSDSFKLVNLRGVIPGGGSCTPVPPVLPSLLVTAGGVNALVHSFSFDESTCSVVQSLPPPACSCSLPSGAAPSSTASASTIPMAPGVACVALRSSAHFRATLLRLRALLHRMHRVTTAPSHALSRAHKPSSAGAAAAAAAADSQFVGVGGVRAFVQDDAGVGESPHEPAPLPSALFSPPARVRASQSAHPHHSNQPAPPHHSNADRGDVSPIPVPVPERDTYVPSSAFAVDVPVPTPSLLFTPEQARVLFSAPADLRAARGGAPLPACEDPDVFDAMSSVSSDEEPDTPLFSYTDAHPSPVGAHTFTNSLAGAGAGAGAGASAGATRSRAAVPVSAAAAGAVTGDVLELGTGDSTAFSLADVSVQAASCPTGALEAGMRFELVDTVPPVSYWIAGRLLGQGREFYVCYDASVHQEVVDLAFRCGV